MYIITFNREVIKGLRDLSKDLSIKLNIQGNIDFEDYEHLIGPLTKIDKINPPTKQSINLEDVWKLRSTKYPAIYNHLEDITLLSGIIGIGSDEIFKILYVNYQDVRDLFFDQTGLTNIEHVPDVYGNTVTSCITYIRKHCLMEATIRKEDYQKILEEKFISNDSVEKLSNLMKTYYKFKYNKNKDFIINTEIIKDIKKESTQHERPNKIMPSNLYNRFEEVLEDMRNYRYEDNTKYIQNLRDELSERLTKGESISQLQPLFEELKKLEDLNNQSDNILNDFILDNGFIWYMEKKYHIPRNIVLFRYVQYNDRCLSPKTYFAIVNTKTLLQANTVYKLDNGSHVLVLDYIKFPEHYKDLENYFKTKNIDIINIAENLNKIITAKISDNYPVHNIDLDNILEKVVI